MSRLSRRQLLEYSAAGAAGAMVAPYSVPIGVLAADGKSGANERAELRDMHCHEYGLVWYQQIRSDQGEITWRRHVILPPKPDMTSNSLRISRASSAAVRFSSFL